MSEQLRLLQVEDSESDAALVVRLLDRGGYEVRSRRVDSPAEMRAALESEAWDVVIADHRMAQFDAPDALRILRETGQDIPFIIVSGSIGEELAVTLMKSGAHDYVSKENLARLIPVVGREVREARSRRDRGQAERDLRASEERMALAIQATQLGTFDYSPQTGQLIWSELAKRHFGLRPDAEVTYETFLRGLHPDDRQRTHRTIQDLLLPSNDGHYAIEYRTVGIDDGEERWVSSWGRVFFDPKGKAVRFVGVTLDITSRKKLEDQFRQAQKLESIGRLAGGIAHDFNNLLTIINGYSDFLLEDMDAKAPSRQPLTEIRKAGQRAAELTRQLLAFSRKQAFDPKPLDLNELISGSRNMLARLIGEDIELVTKLAPDLGNVYADGGQIHQVLMNLVVNSRDAMPKGGCLRIETGKDADYALLVVADNGSGMDEETRRHVFEPFFTTKREGVGTGLGLATVYGIVKQCGGWIDLDTAPGQGATFTIGLPRTAAVIAPSRLPEQHGSAEVSETVLVVEDQDEVRVLAATILKAAGYRLLEARSGDEALLTALQHNGPIHLLLTDVVMPGINGKEVADQICLMRPGMRVLFMSGYGDNVISNRGALGSDMDYLDKPFTREGLLRKVRALLEVVGGEKVVANSPL